MKGKGKYIWACCDEETEDLLAADEDRYGNAGLGGGGGGECGLEGLEEAGEGGLVGGVVLVPGGEVGDEVFTNFARTVFAGVGVEAFPGLEGWEGDKAEGEEHAAVFGEFVFAGFGDFGFDPFAVHAVRGEDEEECVVEADGFVDLLVDFLAGSHVVRGEPAADAGVLEVGVEAVGEALVLSGVGDEAGVELDGFIEEGWEVFDEIFGEAAASEEGNGKGPGFGNGGVVKYARTVVGAVVEFCVF